MERGLEIIIKHQLQVDSVHIVTPDRARDFSKEERLGGMTWRNPQVTDSH